MLTEGLRDTLAFVVVTSLGLPYMEVSDRLIERLPSSVVIINIIYIEIVFI